MLGLPVKLDSLRIDSILGELEPRPPLQNGIDVASPFQEQVAVRDRCKELGPKREHVVVDFRCVVEASECRNPPFEGRRRRRISGIGRRTIAKSATGQPNDFLHEELLRAGNHMITVQKHIIYSRQASRREIAKPSHLNSGRTTGKYSQTISGSMPRQVDQDVNIVCDDFGRHSIVVVSKDRNPGVDRTLNLRR